MKFKIGDSASFSKTISEFDVYQFAGITGDFNPAHINEKYSNETRFKTRIAHGMLIASFISTVLGTQLPGNGTIYLRQEVKFLKPVFIRDTITVKVEVVEILPKGSMKLSSQIFNQDNELVVDGFSEVIPPKDKIVNE
jgi:3-hydroxybutyryl-CoA dehydratase